MSKQNLYLYDRAMGRPLIVDPGTGEGVPSPGAELVHQLLDHPSGDRTLLRRFAIWCAESVIDDAPASARDLLDGARRSLEEDVDLGALRERHAGAAVAAAAVGLRHGAANAAAFLAAYAAADPDPLSGAIAAAQMALLHGGCDLSDFQIHTR